MNIKLLTEDNLEFLNLIGGYIGWSESTVNQNLYHLTYDNITYATLYSPRMRRSNYHPWQTADSRRDIGNRE